MIAIGSYSMLFALMLLAFYQDWRERGIHYLLFPLILFISLILFWRSGFPWSIIGSNALFLSVVFIAMIGYVSLRNGKLTNVFKSDFGWGDVLFLFAITPLFAPQNFILFFISGMILSGIFHLLIGQRVSDSRIPLAGYLANYIVLICSVNLVFGMNLRYMMWI